MTDEAALALRLVRRPSWKQGTKLSKSKKIKSYQSCQLPNQLSPSPDHIFINELKKTQNLQELRVIIRNWSSDYATILSDLNWLPFSTRYKSTRSVLTSWINLRSSFTLTMLFTERNWSYATCKNCRLSPQILFFHQCYLPMGLTCKQFLSLII